MEVRLRRVGPEIDRELGLDAQQIAPFHRPVIGKFVALQQAVDEGGALAGRLVLQERSGLLSSGQRADRVEVDAAQEHRVGAGIRRLNAEPLEPLEDQRVDLALGPGSGAAFESRIQCPVDAGGVADRQDRQKKGETHSDCRNLCVLTPPASGEVAPGVEIRCS